MRDGCCCETLWNLLFLITNYRIIVSCANDKHENDNKTAASTWAHGADDDDAADDDDGVDFN